MASRIAERWGDAVESDGTVDRDAVGARVFNDPDELQWLEQMVHPLVRDELAVWFSGLDADTEFAVVEVPLLFEGEMSAHFDTTVAVVAGEKVRAQRARERGHVGIEGREGRQFSQAKKAERAQHVVSNDGTPEQLQQRLGELLERLVGQPPKFADRRP